jgi:hypothetical protein
MYFYCVKAGSDSPNPGRSFSKRAILRDMYSIVPGI